MPPTQQRDSECRRQSHVTSYKLNVCCTVVTCNVQWLQPGVVETLGGLAVAVTTVHVIGPAKAANTSRVLPASSIKRAESLNKLIRRSGKRAQFHTFSELRSSFCSPKRKISARS
eukprot:360213-Chlamydomonas_euryale.AAC.3